MTNRRTPAKRPTTSSTWKPTQPRASCSRRSVAAGAVVVITVLLIFIMKPGGHQQRRRAPTCPPPRRRTPTTTPTAPRPPRPRSDRLDPRATMTAASPRPAFEAGLGFALDPFQRRALDALDEGQSVLVAAPTGSGKTIVAEYAIRLALAGGRQGLLHDAAEGAVEPEVPGPRPRSTARAASGCSPATTR